MTNRLVNNFIEQQKARIDTVSYHSNDLTEEDAQISKVKGMRPQEALTNIGIAYLRSTGNSADGALSEIICGIAIMLGGISNTNPIGKTNNNQQAVETLITQYKSATDLLGPIFAYLVHLSKSTNPEANIAGAELAKCIKEYTELMVYQDRRKIQHKNNFLDFINVLIYECKNSLEINPEAIVLTPPPSAPILPPIVFNDETDHLDHLTEGTAERAPKLQKKKSSIHMSTSIEESLKKLKDLIGLDSVKFEVEQSIDEIKYQKLLAKQGENPIIMSRHMVFTGNPGTGKTTIARILSEIYKHLGVLSKGHMIETDRAGLVAGYLGQTAIKTDEIVTSALGGILFIDEAYALSPEDRDMFGQEAIDTLLKRMEDNRDDLIVIVAGYPSEMERFINSNPGLQSRFTKYIHFDDYDANELREIYELLLKSSGHTMCGDSANYLQEIFEEMDKIRGDKFGNGRTVRNLYERTIRNVASRVIKTMPSNIQLVLPEDVSMNDVNLVLRKNQIIPIRSAELVSTEENEFVSSRDENTHTNEEVSPYKFFSQLGEMLGIFANQQINTEEINTIEEMQCFTRNQIGKQEVFLPLINEIIRILVILENQGLEQNQDARKQLMDERIVPVFNEKSIKIADFFINGYLKKTQI
jgi:SpoVK/Ycf46/Vps4 family AAA+-type ATPase